MSHVNPYPAYKESGDLVLGAIPEHWEVRRLGTLGQFSKGVGGSKQDDTDVGVPCVRYGHLYTKYEYHIREVRSFIAHDVAARYTEIQHGDTLFAASGESLDEIGKSATYLTSDRAVCGGDVIIFRPGPAVNAEFLGYAADCQASNTQKALMGKGFTVLHIYADQLKGLYISLPPPSEQVVIAKHLRRALTRIDILIEKKTRFIELLKEKRQALITHVVTKGLNPDAPMKESGIESLGEVPAHWMVVRLKLLTPSITVGIVVDPSKYIANDGLPFIYGGDVSEGQIHHETARCISPDDSNKNSKTKLAPGDLIIVRVGAPGVTAVVPPECEGGNCASVVLIRRGDYVSNWLQYVMNSQALRFQVKLVQYGAAQEQFNVGHAVDFVIPVPPMGEQKKLSEALSYESGRIEQLIEKTLLSIDLLLERRSALITAAVTGKIDVRDAA